MPTEQTAKDEGSSAAGAAPIAPVQAGTGAWRVETVPTSVGHCHKIRIDPEGVTSRGPGYDDALIACVYVDHRDMREKDRRTVVGAERARLIAAAPDLLEALRAMVNRWEPDTTGADRRMWEDACDAITRATEG